MNRALAFALFIVGTLGSTGVVAGQSFKVIVHASNAATSVSTDELAKIFLKKTTHWSDGESVAPVDLSAVSVVRKAFCQTILGKSVTAVKAYWQQQIFAGKSVPPAEKDADGAVLQYVASNPGGIGYVSAGTDLSGYSVKIIAVTL